VSWIRALARSLQEAETGELHTLADARAYVLKRKPDVTDRAWQRAMRLMLEAAEVVTSKRQQKQLELALLIDGALD
jgi:hypothetical protein